MPLAGATVKAYNAIEDDTVSTSQTTTSTTYTDLATAGPEVTVHLESGQSVLLIIDASTAVSAEGAVGAFISVEVAGPSTSDLAASDDNGSENGNIRFTPASKHIVFTATAAGDHVCTMKYRVAGAITGTFKERRLVAIVQP